MSSSALVGTKGVPRAEREQQILAVAIDEFAARGYAGASMVVIARRAGISKPLIYQYFGSKDGLYLTCLHHVAGALLERLELAQQQEDDSVASRVHTLQAVFEALEPQRSAWRLLYDTTLPTTGEIADAALGYQARTAELAESGAERFLRSRGHRSKFDASALSAAWMGLVNALVTWWLEHPDESAEDMTQRCYRLIAAVIGTPG
ncbi:MAG TPA: TetR/AcrR family transcriptional regulator [Chloroflexi bacterium]|nr:TetR/AcrR family transcriptional regulator [Chloroflexota bacterium]